MLRKKWLITLVLEKEESVLDEDAIELGTRRALVEEFSDRGYTYPKYAIVSSITVKEIGENV